jgi:hypothetical protein
MKRTNILFLTGGLGNQLFQLAYGLHVSPDGLEIDQNSGTPRMSSRKIPDILEFNLPKNIFIVQRNKLKLMTRILGYNLRLGIVPKGIEGTRGFKFIVRLVSSIASSIYYRRIVRVFAAKGVGFDEKAKSHIWNRVVIGYFQSFRWTSEPRVLNKLKSLSIRNPSDAYTDLLKAIRQEPVIVLHIRLGDYLQEPAFGTPNKSYYAKGLADLISRTGVSKVWGFSDQPELAQKLLGDDFRNQIIWVNQETLSSAETMDLMRNGHGYLIANSTFSWWAAMLRHSSSAPVIAPTPWFKAMEEPNCLVPSDWLRLNAYSD